MGFARHCFGLAIVCGLPIIAAIFVTLRVIARRRRKIRLSWNDWVLVLATLLSFGLIGPSIIDFRLFHWGYHVWEYPRTTRDTEWNFDQYYHTVLSFQLLSIPILPLSKISIILLLLHVGKIIDPIRRFLYITLTFTALAALVPWALFIFICPPSPSEGPLTTFGGLHCLNPDMQGKVLLFVNCANLLTDILVFPVPFFIMNELMNTTLQSKLIILLTFATSLCVTSLSALKIHVTSQDRINLSSTCGHGMPCRITNIDWMWSLDYCITHGEANVGIIVACIPTLRGLISSRPSTEHTPPQIPSFVSGSVSDGDVEGSSSRELCPGAQIYAKSDGTGSNNSNSPTTELAMRERSNSDSMRNELWNNHTFHATPPLPPVGQW